MDEGGWEAGLSWALLSLSAASMGCLQQGSQISYVAAQGSRRPKGKPLVLRKAGSGTGSLPPCSIGQGSHRPAHIQRGDTAQLLVGGLSKNFGHL